MKPAFLKNQASDVIRCTAVASLRQLRAACLIVPLIFSSMCGDFAKGAEPEPWRWEPSLVPRALVVEGLWSEFFRIEPAMHTAGLLYRQAYVSRSPYFGVYTRFYNLPTAGELRRFSVIVIANLDAPSLGPERLKLYREFVSEGGGLVVLGGYWAYSRGAYGGTPLEEILPAAFPPEHRIPVNRGGLPLSPAPEATWRMPFDFSAKPSAFYVQALEPKPGATVQLLAGTKPAFISGTFGKGRVVACALTANGDPPNGVLPFWDWPDCPKLIGQAIDWAAGARPLTPLGAATAPKPAVSEDEFNSLALGSDVTPDLARRICERPNPQTAEALFLHIMRPEGGGKVDLAMAHRALLPFAKPAWSPRLRDSLEKFSPDLASRQAGLILLGASKDPAGFTILQEAVQKDVTKDASIEALGWLGNPAAIPLIRELLARAEGACKAQATEDEPTPDVFARLQGSTIVESAIALYRLGEPEALPRLLEVYRRVRLFDRIFKNAIKRRVAETDLQGIGILKRLHEGEQKLGAMLARLRQEAGPIPESQRTPFDKMATEATEPADVEWLCLAMEQSASSRPAPAWHPLMRARDGIVARLASALAGGK